MTEQQAQAATAAYARLLAARKDLDNLHDIQPLICDMSLGAGPGMPLVRIRDVGNGRLHAAAQILEAALTVRITELEQALAQL